MSRRDTPQTHENFVRDGEAPSSSPRAFGFVFAAISGLMGLWPLWRGGAPRWWSLALAVAFLAAALVVPRALAPLNRLWRQLALLLHAVVTPVVMALVFFTTVTPIALIMRALGKHPLRLRLDHDARTYWIERRPPGPTPDTMPRQF
jgi:Saxitoxin biosynthesis operon protein SxtJ